MARIDTLSNFLTDVADSIRNKTGGQAPIPAENFDAEIASITTGGGVPLPGEEITVTALSNIHKGDKVSGIFSANPYPTTVKKNADKLYSNTAAISDYTGKHLCGQDSATVNAVVWMSLGGYLKVTDTVSESSSYKSYGFNRDASKAFFMGATTVTIYDVNDELKTITPHTYNLSEAIPNGSSSYGVNRYGVMIDNYIFVTRSTNLYKFYYDEEQGTVTLIETLNLGSNASIRNVCYKSDTETLLIMTYGGTTRLCKLVKSGNDITFIGSSSSVISSYISCDGNYLISGDNTNTKLYKIDENLGAVLTYTINAKQGRLLDGNLLATAGYVYKILDFTTGEV